MASLSILVGHPCLLVLLYSTSSIPKLQDVLQHSRPASMKQVFSNLQQSGPCLVLLYSTSPIPRLHDALQHSRPAPIEPFFQGPFRPLLVFPAPCISPDFGDISCPFESECLFQRNVCAVPPYSHVPQHRSLHSARHMESDPY
ncbi:hypothetical protein CY34DRAFT_678986 [Suillus luteus UH-Slu-Lm8-n1]|uniref:Uncharacterized protein n=1 Tax=Suillus luteus UH-Slu-Lm8-n1 TaxID=930992 RepID=A0A0D0A6U6_9AGAM|nr:hypothetical protein CY34DRAFT_678986 [Suillus luteus UH-Slu-Lm8-n1]